MGQVTLPKSVLQALSWKVGTRLVVESAHNGVLLKPDSVSLESNSEDVIRESVLRCPGRFRVSGGTMNWLRLFSYSVSAMNKPRPKWEAYPSAIGPATG